MNLTETNKLHVWVWLALIPCLFFGLEIMLYKTTGKVPTVMGGMHELLVFPLIGLGLAALVMAVKALLSHPDSRRTGQAVMILLLCAITAAAFIVK